MIYLAATVKWWGLSLVNHKHSSRWWRHSLRKQRERKNTYVFNDLPKLQYVEGITEENVLFNDELSTAIWHLVNNPSQIYIQNIAATLLAALFISSKMSFYMHHPTERIVHIMTFVTPIVVQWLEWEIAQSVLMDWCVEPSSQERLLYLWATPIEEIKRFTLAYVFVTEND